VKTPALLHRTLHSPFGPVLSALGLGVLSTPIAAGAIASLRVSTWDHAAALSDRDLAGPMALLAVVAAGLVAGLVAGSFVRQSPIGGLCLAVLIAWPVAVATLPILPALARVGFAGLEVCLDSCGGHPAVSADLRSGVALFFGSLLLDVIFIVPAVLAVVLAVVGRRVGRHRRRVLGAALGLAAVSCAYAWWAVAERLTSEDVRLYGQSDVPFGDPGLAFACLVAGAVVWVLPWWRDAAGRNETPAVDRAADREVREPARG
jgi:hypothetical protein